MEGCVRRGLGDSLIRVGDSLIRVGASFSLLGIILITVSCLNTYYQPRHALQINRYPAIINMSSQLSICDEFVIKLMVAATHDDLRSFENIMTNPLVDSDVLDMWMNSVSKLYDRMTVGFNVYDKFVQRVLDDYRIGPYVLVNKYAKGLFPKCCAVSEDPQFLLAISSNDKEPLWKCQRNWYQMRWKKNEGIRTDLLMWFIHHGP